MKTVIPTNLLPLIETLDNSIPFVKRCALSFDGLGYGNYATGLALLNAPDDYTRGAIQGWEVLSGDGAVDLALLDAIAQMRSARIAKDKSFGFGDGGLDIWRLFVEKNGSIVAVIAAQ